MKNFQFKKKYGQNFISDVNLINSIISKSKIAEKSLIIEIGPGAGALTKKLVETNNTVLSYEIDNELIPILKKQLSDYNNFNLINDDFLKRDLKKDVEKYIFEEIYVIANLPYYITTPIINKIIASDLNVKKIVIMVQKEVGERFAAKPRSRNYGSITVFLNYYFEINKLIEVNRNMFYPVPNVDSVVIELLRKEKTLSLNNETIFNKLIKDSFAQKRKNIKNNLKNYDLETIKEVLNKYNLDLTARAEELSLDVFVDIANKIKL